MSGSGRFHLATSLGGPARRQVVLVLAGVLGLQSADSGAIGSLAAPIESAFHVGNVAIGLIATASTLVGVVTTLPFGVVVDRWNRTRLLQVVAVVWGVSTVLSGLSASYGMLLAVRVFQGGLTAVAGPALASLAGDLFPGEERGRLWSYVLVGELAGAGVGILVTGVLLGVTDWRVALSTLGIPAFALAWALHRYLPEPLRGGAGQLAPGAARVPSAGAARGRPGGASPRLEEPSPVERGAEQLGIEPDPRIVLGARRRLTTWEAVRYVLRIPSNDALIVASGIGYFFVQGLEIFAELFFRERYGVSVSAASVLFVVIAAGALLGVVLSGQAADRLIAHGHPAGRMVVGAVTFAGTTVIFLPSALLTTAALAVPLMVIAAGFLGAVNPPVDTARLDVVPSFLWGRAEAVRTALRQALQGLAPLLFGLVSAAFGAPRTGLGAGVNTHTQAATAYGHGLEVAFMLFSLPMVAAGATLWFSRRAYLRDVVAARRSDELHLGA